MPEPLEVPLGPTGPGQMAVAIMKSGQWTYTFTVDQQPDKAGIDPFALLIDRVPDDNTKSVELVSSPAKLSNAAAGSQ